MPGASTRARKRLSMVKQLAETWVRRPSSPTRVVFDVTRRCNLRCEMCHTWKSDGEDELSVPEIADILRQLPRLTWLDVTGGEVFLRKDALQLIEAIAQTTPSLCVLHFPSNGWFTRRIVEATRAFVDARPEVELIITVSIDGPPEVHDAIRGRKGAFDRALETYRQLRGLAAQHRGLSVYVGTTVTATSEPHLAELEAQLAASVPGFDGSDWHWNRLQISEHFFQNGALDDGPARPDRSHLDEHVRRRGMPRSLVEIMELGFLINAEFVDRGEASNIPCQSLRSTAFISPEGELYPCHVWDRPLGSLREHSLADLWESPEVLQAREQVQRLDCGGCFTPCEAYPALAGAPGAAVSQTVRRGLQLWQESRRE